jgi:colanic acid/amylovoran biosynthesis glycosyltransferase
MISVAYVVSRFPVWSEMFILREVCAVTRHLDTRLSIFSLKLRRDRLVEEARPFLKTTYYPSLRGLIHAVSTFRTSMWARNCAREVLTSYRGRPTETLKAFVTLFLAAAMIPRIQRLNVRHVHAHWATMPALAAYFIKGVIGIPYSVTAHAWDIYADTTMLREKLDGAEFVVTCTTANLDVLQHVVAHPERLFLCYHGLDFDSLPPPVFNRSSELRILAVGRLVEQKGFADLIKACHLLYQQGVAFECHIIGDGPLAIALKALIRQYRLDHVVALSGVRRQSEVFRAYHWASVLCVPSIIARDGNRDGIPNVILEAMSQGLPVVASCVSGIPEVVQPFKTGWLLAPADPTSLAETLLEVYRTPETARRRAEAAYELVRSQFDVHKNTGRLLQLFNSVDRSRGRAVSARQS